LFLYTRFPYGIASAPASLKGQKNMVLSSRKPNVHSGVAKLVEYLGYKIDAKGLHTTPKTIQQVPRPKTFSS